MVLARGSGQNLIVFGLVTPLDHPPETTQWVTAWVGGYYILYINRIKRWSRVGGRVGSRDQNKHIFAPILASKIKSEERIVEIENEIII